MFELADVSVRFGPVMALSGIGLTVSRGELVTIAGPNGAGKSTLLRVLAGLEKGASGTLLLEGTPLQAWQRPALARRLAYVAQQTRMIFPYSAREVVLMGRLPHQQGRFFDSTQDASTVSEAMETTDCLQLADRVFHTLSGGEQQLVLLASALAQQPEILLLDEPTAFLDLRHQLQIGRILRRLHQREGLTIVLATHDLSLADKVSDRLLLLKAGALMAEVAGAASRTSGLTAELIGRLFGLEAVDVERAGQRRIEVRFGE